MTGQYRRAPPDRSLFSLDPPQGCFMEALQESCTRKGKKTINGPAPLDNARLRPGVVAVGAGLRSKVGHALSMLRSQCARICKQLPRSCHYRSEGVAGRFIKPYRRIVEDLIPIAHAASP